MRKSIFWNWKNDCSNSYKESRFLGFVGENVKFEYVGTHLVLSPSEINYYFKG